MLAVGQLDTDASLIEKSISYLTDINGIHVRFIVLQEIQENLLVLNASNHPHRQITYKHIGNWGLTQL